MHRRRPISIYRLLIAAALGVAGCSSDMPTSGAPDGLMPCTGNMTSGPPSDFTVYFDTVALPSFPNGPRLDNLDPDRGSDGRRFTKFGLYFRPTKAFALKVAEEQRSNVNIGWGHSVVPHVDAANVPCEGAQPGWVVLPGGLWLKSDTCARIEVSSGAERAVAELPLGGPCG